MGIFDVVLVLAWVLVAITLSVATCVLMGADWRELSKRLLRRRDAHGRARVCRGRLH